MQLVAFAAVEKEQWQKDAQGEHKRKYGQGIMAALTQDPGLLATTKRHPYS